MANNLIHESSLYLQQHAQNPVNWFPWGDEALNKAKEEDKPILVSIGYSSCHWCHVMERESFESQEIADFLNAHFVAIKVDREERPDIDHIYMEALQTLSGQGGWPLNMFLTPDQKPFYGGTYFPPQPRYGRPSFLQILHRIHELFTEKRTDLEKNALQLTQAIGNDVLNHIPAEHPNKLVIDEIIEHFSTVFEPEFGGFSTSPKFPQPMVIEALIRLGIQEESPKALEMALKTLREMANGGIYDQIGGGFHRYSTDKEWLVPHFEKMLYDNAQLLHVYAMAYRITGDEYFKDVANGIYSCLERDFRNKNAGFGSAWDADSNGVEGEFYCWTFNELNTVLSKSEIDLLKKAKLDLSENGNWEGKIIFRFAQNTSVKEKENLKPIFRKLFELRNERVHPQKDKKEVLAWNAMVLQSYFTWFWVNPDSILKDNILSDLDRIIIRKKEIGFYERVSGVKAFGDDLAHFGLALIRGFQLSGNDNYLKEAVILSDLIRDEFYDSGNNSFSLASNHHRLIHTAKEVFDNAVPSTQAICTRFFQELGYIIDDRSFSILAELANSKLFSLVQKYPSSCANHLVNAIMFRNGKNECICLGDESVSWLSELSNRQFLETSFFMIPFSNNSEFSVLSGKISKDKKAKIFWCEQFMCKDPAFSRDEFRKRI